MQVSAFKKKIEETQGDDFPAAALKLIYAGQFLLSVRGEAVEKEAKGGGGGKEGGSEGVEKGR